MNYNLNQTHSHLVSCGRAVRVCVHRPRDGHHRLFLLFLTTTRLRMPEATLRRFGDDIRDSFDLDRTGSEEVSAADDSSKECALM